MRYERPEMRDDQHRKDVDNNTEYTRMEDAPYRLNHAKLRRMQKMERGLHFILHHLDQDNCTLEETAKEAGYDPAYFARLFAKYFEMPFNRFVTKLKVRAAARDILEQDFPKHPGKKYSFANSQIFSKVFRKEFGVSPRQFHAGDYEVPDMPLRKKVEGVEITLEYQQVNALKMEGMPLSIPWGNETYLMDTLAWAFSEEVAKDPKVPTFKCREDQIGIWWYDPDEQLHYLFGKVLEEYGTAAAPEQTSRGEQSLNGVIQGGNYAVFSYPRPKKDRDIYLQSRIMARYVFKEWVPINHKVTNVMGFTYERFTSDRIYLYLPLTIGMGGTDRLRRREWLISGWTAYIDEHIHENLTLESLARIAGYSTTNYHDVFVMYYGISPTEYIRKRRQYLNSRGHGSENKETVLDLQEYYDTNRNRVRMMIRTVKDREAVLHHIRLQPEPEDTSFSGSRESAGIMNMTELIIYWFRNTFDDFRPMSPFLSGIGKKQSKIFVWDTEATYENGEMGYRYSVGALLKYRYEKELLHQYLSQTDIRRDQIDGGKYAIFMTLNASDEDDPKEAFHMLTRCAFGGWIHENRHRCDLSRRTFVIWRDHKLFFYVPLIS